MRMGPHVNTTHRAHIAADYIRRVKPDAVKVLNSGMDRKVIDAAVEVGALIIGRVHWDGQKFGPEHGEFIRRVVDFARSHPEIQWFEGANEWAQAAGELERYAELEIERMKALEAIGRKAVIGNFSCGQPQYADWPRFRPALEYAARGGHALGLHEYSGPVMQWMTGENQVTKKGPDGRMLEWRLDDACERPGVQGHLTLRYRHVLEMARTWGIGNPRICLTETGIDDVNPRPGPQGKGWKSYLGTEYANKAPFGDYASQLGWYGRRLTEDENVIAWVDFGFSQAGDWATFDLSNDTPMRERVIAEMLQLPRGHVAAPAPPSPVPPAPAPPATGVVYVTAKSYSPRGGVRPRYIVVHSTDSPAGSSPAGTMRYLQENDRQVSVHELVIPGAVYVMVPDGMAAHHAGNATLPDGATGGAVNAASWGTEMYQVHGEPVAVSLVDVCVARVAAACRRLDIPSRNVLGHREIDPGRRSDPVGVDMVAFRAAVAAKLGESSQPAPGPDVARLIEAAKAEHLRAGVKLNPGSAIQRTMLADGLVITTNEATAEGVTYARGESAAAGAWVYWWREGRVHKAKMT